MYIHLGQAVVVLKKSVIGIFDMDNCTASMHTRAFLKKAEEEGNVVAVSGELPKVFAVCQEGGKSRVYLSQLAPATLLKRWESDSFDA
jgi:hypothetical protein